MATRAPKTSKPTGTPATAIATQAAARNTDSAPAHPGPAVAGDLPTQRAADTQALVAAMPANDNKPLEHGMDNAMAPPRGLTAKPASRLPGGSSQIGRAHV